MSEKTKKALITTAVAALLGLSGLGGRLSVPPCEDWSAQLTAERASKDELMLALMSTLQTPGARAQYGEPE